MNRREFTRNIAALGLAPALPALPAAAATSAAPAFTPYMYGLGAHMARSTGVSSPAMLMTKLRIPLAAAQAMQAQLTRSGILNAPNAAGLAMAANPYMAPARAAVTSSTAGKTAQRLVRHLTKTEGTTDQDIPQEKTPD